jgi:hypothetical protein
LYGSLQRQFSAIFHQRTIEHNSHQRTCGLLAVRFGFRHVAQDFRIPGNHDLTV